MAKIFLVQVVLTAVISTFHFVGIAAVAEENASSSQNKTGSALANKGQDSVMSTGGLSANEIARKRLYPGGNDEESLQVMEELPNPPVLVDRKGVQVKVFEQVVKRHKKENEEDSEDESGEEEGSSETEEEEGAG